jgi:hypothetical protein
LTPRGEVVPLGVKFSFRPSILLNPGRNEGVNIHPRGQILPLGTKFTPRSQG